MTLFVVGTPIGNLEDITARAVTTLSQVEHIAAEDTRRTRALLSHLGIHGKHLHALDANAPERRILGLVEHLVAGESVALVTDAGMPSVSDPGTALVREAAAQDVPVVVVPGPSALTAAVAVSGLVEGPFLFLGFLPRAGGKRRAALERIAATAEPVVVFEAGNRTAATLADLAALVPARRACVCRELTKLHEESARGTLADLADPERAWRGEIAIVIGAGDSVRARPGLDDAELDARIVARLAEGASPRTVTDELLQASALPRRELYARVQRLRD